MTQQTQWTFACSNLLQILRLCCGLVDLLSHELVTDLLRETDVMDFGPNAAKDIAIKYLHKE